MKLYPITTNTFNGKPLFPLNLKVKQQNGEYQTTPALFVELNYDDNRDVCLMEKINKIWLPQMQFINYATPICRNFFRPNHGIPLKRFFAIQVDNKSQSPFDRTAAIMETTNPERYPKNHMEIDFLQSATSIIPGFLKIKAKGAGEQSVAGAAKFAQMYDLDNIKIFSTNNTFYDRLGLKVFQKSQDGTYYIIEKKDFDEFIKKTENRYR